MHRQWIAFLTSGVLPIPEKQARDLCAAWEGWLRDSDVTDGDLVNIGTRTLAKIKALEPNERKRVIKKIKSGDKVTEKDVTSTSTPSKPMSEAAMRKRLAELQAENASLKIENESLKKKVDELDLLVAQPIDSKPHAGWSLGVETVDSSLQHQGLMRNSSLIAALCRVDSAARSCSGRRKSRVLQRWSVSSIPGLQLRRRASRNVHVTRSGRDLLGAPRDVPPHGCRARRNSQNHRSRVVDGDHRSTPRDLIVDCELVVLSANNHIEEDLLEACRLREELGREQVVLACLSVHSAMTPSPSYVLCEKQPNLAFFSGFHRHGALRNPFDSFTANFCHPNALTAMLGAQLLDRLSPNIQVSAGVHNVEGQYIKAAKNMASVFAGFGYGYHQDNPGVLPTLFTLLLDQCSIRLPRCLWPARTASSSITGNRFL